MNDEIKEILDRINNYPEKLYCLNENEKHLLLDYITNLQQENERLKETNVYCNRTDCVGRIKDSKKYDSVYQEKNDYKSRCEKAISKVNDLYSYADNEEYVDNYCKDLLNILQNGSEKDE